MARTSTFALSNVTRFFVLALADKGLQRALNEDPHLRNGLNVHAGASLTVPSPRGSSKTTRMLIMRCGFNEIEFR